MNDEWDKEGDELYCIISQILIPSCMTNPLLPLKQLEFKNIVVFKQFVSP